MQEWLDHYRAEGVEQFVIIDNGSDDSDTGMGIFAAAPDVLLVVDKTRHAQNALYNTYGELSGALMNSEWLLVLDFDEFLYGRHGKTVAEVLRSLPSNVGSVSVPWLMFGSSGLLEQPDGVVQHFLMRQQYPGSGSDSPAYLRYEERKTCCLFAFHAFQAAPPPPSPPPQQA